jgi:hypothetical protein
MLRTLSLWDRRLNTVNHVFGAKGGFMAILAQRPIGCGKQEVSNKRCKCGVDSDKAKKAMVRSHYAANVLEWRFLVAYVALRKI